MRIGQIGPQVCDVLKVEGEQSIQNQKGKDHHNLVVWNKDERKENRGQELGREADSSSR